MHDGSAHDHRIRAFALRFEQPLDWTMFGIWLSMLLAARGEDVLRVKGLLNAAGSEGPVVINGVQHVIHPPVHLAAWPDDDRSLAARADRARDRGRRRRALAARVPGSRRLEPRRGGE